MFGKIFRFFIPKFFVIASLMVAFWVGSATFKEMDRGKRIQEEITSLHAEAQKTQRENTLLKERIRYFQTDAFQEQEARNKLNYQSPNEKTVVIKSIVHDDTVEAREEVSDLSKTHNLLPNYEKWWRQFFTE